LLPYPKYQILLETIAASFALQLWWLIEVELFFLDHFSLLFLLQ